MSERQVSSVSGDYEPPSLTSLGTVEQLTQADVAGILGGSRPT